VETEEVQACLVAFNAVCSYISTRDLVQEHIPLRVKMGQTRLLGKVA
jgi:hypothetical protein